MLNKKLQIIEISAKLIHSKGYEKTSIQDILQAAQIGKGQFYYYFSSKQDLGIEVVDYCFEKWNQRVIKGILESEADPKAKIEKMLACAIDVHTKNGSKCGCFFGNLAVELSEHNEIFREKTNKVFESWIHHLEIVLDELMRQEKLPLSCDSHALAQSIVAMLEGGIMLMKNRQDIAALITVSNVVKKMVCI
ncbi:transcriptional regulator, TetR family [Propionispira arboris]|uniref:Transcriptional regulator, TetR family n=1 Tax=Propionispira arboris TaxID=84035 RepID=A0A1H7BRH6_9FIRM|nr:TetR/AcrR family transcriptional regulator [Propionispira arboris]SEJ80199.1 transcriptional regulator, TetR family [Propionispira arboris]